MSEGIARYRRFTGWNYAKGASLFITVATEPRRALFGRIVNGKVALSHLGEIVAESLDAIPRLNGGISLYGRVVMPDHVHFNCHLAANLDEPLKTLGNAVRRFKNYTNKQARLLAEHNSAIATGWPSIHASADGRTVFGQTIWQQGYHDHLCLSRRFIDSTERYIAYNPLKWELMYGEKGALRIIEPIDSPRLGEGYWKGVGNISLLDQSHKLVSLRVSREVSSAEAISAVVSRMESAVDKGYVIISGFISPGERAVRDMLCRRHNSPFIRILPSCIPNRRFRPESAYATPFAENRYLEIAEGNEENEFSRRACLDLNAAIINIATSGEGLALYWRKTGPQVLATGRARQTVPTKARSLQGSTL